jgi:hypothetical protein
MPLCLPQWLRWDRRPGRLRQAWPVWLESLAGVRRELAELNQATEQDFLQVGEKLQRFLEVSGQMSEQCSLMVGFLSGAEANQGAGDLHSILDRTRAMAGQAETNQIALAQMLAGVGRIVHPLADLNAKMRGFRVMATLIRIEGARLNQAGVDFETLAEDVRKLASDIEENGRTILTASLGLRDVVRHAGSGLADFEARQEAELPRIQQQAGTSLQALRERRGRAADTSRAMAARYGAVRREIGELVMSLQVHDITRQQVEHAATALGRTEEASSARSAALLARVCALQRAQLDHAKESFLAGVARVRESLAGISRNVSGMAAEGTDVLGGEAEKEDSFLAEMEQGLAGIRAALAECAESRHGLSTVAETVADGVQKMAEFVETIEEIGLRMQRIALNANIKAIQIGEQGTALGAVADAIQRLAADSTDQTQVVALGIREVADGSGRLSAELMEFGEDLPRKLEQVIAAFHAADEENRRRLTEIGETGRSFSGELETLCAGIRADTLLADVIGRSCTRLDEIVAAAEPLAADDPGAEHTQAIQKLEEQYTMHVERAVHQQTTGTPQPVAAAAAGDLGENVELF